MHSNPSLTTRLWATALWVAVGFFVLNLLALIGSVVVSSFGTRWLGTWLPAGFTTRWYAAAWHEFQLDDVLLVTFQVAFSVVILSGLSQPLVLLVISAVTGGLMMFMYSALLLLVNRRTLPAEIRPGAGRVAALVWAFLLFGFLCVLTFNQQLQNLFGG